MRNLRCRKEIRCNQSFVETEIQIQVKKYKYKICRKEMQSEQCWVESVPGLDRNSDKNTNLRIMIYKTRCRKEMGCNQSQVGTQKVAQEKGNYCQPCRPRFRSSCQAPTFQPCSSRSRSTCKPGSQSNLIVQK